MIGRAWAAQSTETRILGVQELAPQSGHVSNLCRPTAAVIEPLKAYYFQNGRHEPLTPVLAWRPDWIRLELVGMSPSSLTKGKSRDGIDFKLIPSLRPRSHGLRTRF